MSKIITSSEISKMDRFFRVNFIHSLAGYKSPFLLATVGENPNLAIFSSIFHLGSNPPLLGIKFRPITGDLHTYHNLKKQGYLTINSIDMDIFRKAHLTSARLSAGDSEFDFAELNMEWRDASIIPFVAESKIKVLAEYKEEYLIKANKTRVVVVEIKWVEIAEDAMRNDGTIELDVLNSVAINGLYNYFLPEFVDILGYVHKPAQ
jgi:flavin reductase (DIM6/NTAB) family NADH-FMN oxidoreductase RutF